MCKSAFPFNSTTGHEHCASASMTALRAMKRPLDLKGITLKRVQAAYKKTGKTPGFGVTGNNTCCALQAIAHAEGFAGKQNEFPHWSYVLGSGGLDFVIGFDQGTRQETPGGRLGNKIAIGLGLRPKASERIVSPVGIADILST
jgi:hypothetical protein